MVMTIPSTVTITIQERLVGIKCCQPTMKRLEKIELQDICIDMIEQLLNILSFIHANNILHLDISMSNVMLKPKLENGKLPKLVLMDFNSSHLMNGVHKPIFKFPYTHPVEQWRFSPAADLYSSGIVISEIQFFDFRMIQTSFLPRLGDYCATCCLLKNVHH